MKNLAYIGGLFIVGILATLVITIILAITVAPDRKRDKLKGFGRWLNDLFNFRSLLIEAITKFFYILTTVAFVVIGFFMLFLVIEQPSYNYVTGAYETSAVWYGWIGLILMVVGPIVTRFLFEGMMLWILLVNNTIKINNKLKDQNKPEAVVKAPKSAPVAEPVVQPVAQPEANPITENKVE